MESNDDVRVLQSELIRLLKGALGKDEFEAPEGRVLEIRRRIRQLDPGAALYEIWGGAMPNDESGHGPN